MSVSESDISRLSCSAVEIISLGRRNIDTSRRLAPTNRDSSEASNYAALATLILEIPLDVLSKGGTTREWYNRELRPAARARARYVDKSLVESR